MAAFDDSTIFAPATPVGQGAISVIRISGPSTLPILDGIVSFRHASASEARPWTMKFGVVYDSVSGRDSGAPVLDEVVVGIYRAPHSYTGEDCAEISCHASSYIVSRLLELLSSAGARMARPGEFTERAYLAGKMDLSQAEAVADVIAASSAAEHRVAMNQLRGGYSNELEVLRDSLMEIASLIELELDFSEEDVEFADRSKIRTLASSAAGHCSRLAASFRDGNALKSGIPVAIIGAPNSGKSTLLNAILGDDRAIVSDIPGTTRDTVEDSFILDGVKFRLIDTAGLRSDPSDRIEAMGIERSIAAASRADVIIGVVDASAGPAGVSAAVREISTVAASSAAGGTGCSVDSATAGVPGAQLILVYNKADLCGPGSAPCGPGAPIWMSAKNGDGVDTLKAALGEYAASRFGRRTGTDNGIVPGASAATSIVTSERHASALKAASAALDRVCRGLDTLPTDLLAQDLREALYHLGTITGTITSDEVLGNIFSKFCIGK